MHGYTTMSTLHEVVVVVVVVIVVVVILFYSNCILLSKSDFLFWLIPDMVFSPIQYLILPTATGIALARPKLVQVWISLSTPL